jgi:hypothetical protein
MLQQALATLAVVDSITVNRRRETLDQQQPAEEYLGPRGVMRYFNSASGNRICCYYYPAEGTAKGVVQLVHGMGSFLTYDYLAFQVGACSVEGCKEAWRQEEGGRSYLQQEAATDLDQTAAAAAAARHGHHTTNNTPSSAGTQCNHP